MSDIVKRKKHAKEQRLYRERHMNDPAWVEHRRELDRQAYVRRKKRMSMERDAVELLRGQNRRLKKRLAVVESELAVVESELHEFEDAASNESWDDELDELEAADADDGDAAAQHDEWSEATLRKKYEYARSQEGYTFHRRTSLSATQFDTLWSLIEDHWLSTTFTGEPRLYKSASDEQVSPKLQFYVLLYWLRTGTAYWEIEDMFDLPESYVAKIIKRGTAVLARVAEAASRELGGIGMPSIDELRTMASARAARGQHALSDYPLTIGEVVFRLPRPPSARHAELKSKFWCGQHKCWGMVCVTLMDMQGQIVFAFDPLRASETAVVQERELVKLLSDAGVGVLTDSLYAFNEEASSAEKPSSAKASSTKSEPAPPAVKHMFSLGPRTSRRLKRIAFDHELPFSDKERATAKQWLFTAQHVEQWSAVREDFSAQLQKLCVVVKEMFRRFPQRLGETSEHAPNPSDVMKSVVFLTTFRKRMSKNQFLRAPDWQPEPLELNGELPPNDFVAGYPSIADSPVPANGLQASGIVRRLWQVRLSKRKARKYDRQDAELEHDSVDTSDRGSLNDSDGEEWEPHGDFNFA